MIGNPFLYKKLISILFYEFYTLSELVLASYNLNFVMKLLSKLQYLWTAWETRAQGLEQEAGSLPIYFPALLVPGRRAVLGHIPSNDTFTEYSATSYHGIFSFLPSAQTMQYPNQTSCHRWSVEKGQPCRNKRTLRRVRHPQTPVLVSGKWMNVPGPYILGLPVVRWLQFGVSQ